MSTEFFNESMLDMFLFETEQLMIQLEDIVMSDENQGFSTDTINELFRIMHTTKGSAAMMQFDNISSLAHAMEDLFYFIREKNPRFVNYSILADLILEGIDFIKTEVEKMKNKVEVKGDFSALTERIKDYLEQLKAEEAMQESQLPEENPAYFNNPHMDEAVNYFSINLFFEDDCQMENLRAFEIIHHLKSLVKELFHVPFELDESTNIDRMRTNGLYIYLGTELTENEIISALQESAFIKDFVIKLMEEITDLKEFYNDYIKMDKDNFIDNGLKEQENEGNGKENNGKADSGKAVTAKAEQKELQSSGMQQSIISVNISKLDKLMDLVGEMVIAEAMVIQNPDLKGLVLDNFQKASRQLTKITGEIQDLVMTIRMVPLTATFHKMHRIVRDMCKKLGKDVELQLIGQDTEVDKNIIEHISDPLMHLVRNALDHGIEPPEERAVHNKKAKGTLILEAKNAGSDVIVTIKDDGKGLNREVILKKAQDNNLLLKPMEEYTDKEIYNLIFLPGFSTKDNVSEFSGRGVGMDVVAKNLEMVGGSVSIDSYPGKGTNITLKVPLTLAIIDGMNLRVGNTVFTLPTISVREFFKPRAADIISDSESTDMIMVRGIGYRILKLQEAFHITNARTNYEDGIIIMIEQDENSLCVFADELLGQQQVVVKALPEYIRRVKKIQGISGCTLLGDGSISLIMDIAGLLRR